MAQAIDRPALHEIEITFASIVPQKGAFAADKDDLRARGDVHQGVERICRDIHVETPLRLDEKKAGQNERRPHVVGAAFSKTLLIWLFSAGVGHGATHHRRGCDDGKWRGGWSG
jgi:hypothetical protein